MFERDYYPELTRDIENEGRSWGRVALEKFN